MKDIRILGIALLVSFLAACAKTETSSHAWPEIVAITKTTHIADANSADAALEFNILGTDGKKLYAIKCHSGDYEDEAYSGLIQCYLESLYSLESFNDLFTETDDEPADWTNRGRFLGNHIVGSCADYPEFGRIRHFFLRGMKVSIVISSVIVDTAWKGPPPASSGPPAIKSYDLTISVERSPQSTSAITAVPKIPEPKWFYKTGPCPN